MAKEKISFEKALERLEKIVATIEEGKVPLEESIDKYAEGIKLIAQCRGILDRAEKKIQLLTKDKGPALQPAGELDEEEPDVE